ncbi:MAG: hypothetical protein Q7S89_00955 [bacterium]|nr:hypothetical protein [bacterium]
MISRRVSRESVDVLLLSLVVGLVLVGLFMPTKARCEELPAPPVITEITFEPDVSDVIVGSAHVEADPLADCDNIVTEVAKNAFGVEVTTRTCGDAQEPTTPVGIIKGDGQNLAARSDAELEEPIAAPIVRVVMSRDPIHLALLVGFAIVVLVLANWRVRAVNRRVQSAEGITRECADVADEVTEADLGSRVAAIAPAFPIGEPVIDPRLGKYIAQAAERRRRTAWASPSPILLTREMKKSRPAPPNGAGPN